MFEIEELVGRADLLRPIDPRHPLSADLSAMLIASEFMPVSLLTPMAEGLRASDTGTALNSRPGVSMLSRSRCVFGPMTVHARAGVHAIPTIKESTP